MTKRRIANEPSSFRFMCVRTDGKNYHVDFSEKEEALKYVEDLDTHKIEWYGLYELCPDKDYLVMVTHKRIIPHKDDFIIRDSSSSENKKPTRRRRME